MRLLEEALGRNAVIVSAPAPGRSVSRKPMPMWLPSAALTGLRPRHGSLAGDLPRFVAWFDRGR